MAEFQIKRDATQPFLRVEFLDGNGSAVDLTNASNIYFKLATNDNQYTPVFSGNATITGSTAGLLDYRWASTDTARSGLYLGEFVTTFTDGTKLTLPTDHSLYVYISEDYDGS